LHPKLPGTFYRDILLAVKKELPDLHVHAFSPFEIWYGASKTKLSYKDFLADLKECGLGSMPGTAAEILDTEVRKQLTENKLSAEKWIEIIKQAHSLKIPTSSTIMYGHIDGPIHWAQHINLLREIQKETGGFTELVPLSFVYKDSPLYLNGRGKVRKGPTVNEVNKMHAVSRLMLQGWIDNIQVSWTKLGLERARQLLNYGVNDLGGTLMNESISRSAGSNYGQEITPFELVKLIRSVGKVPIQRNTLYKTLDNFLRKDPPQIAPLVSRTSDKTIDFLNQL
jgi:FO synthase